MMQAPCAVELAVREAFPDADHAAVMQLLNSYGTESHERERERVQLTIVKICQGDLSRLAYQVEIAKIDYRDILVFASRPLPSAEEGASLKDAALDVLRRWGKK